MTRQHLLAAVFAPAPNDGKSVGSMSSTRTQ